MAVVIEGVGSKTLPAIKISFEQLSPTGPILVRYTMPRGKADTPFCINPDGSLKVFATNLGLPCNPDDNYLLVIR